MNTESSVDKLLLALGFDTELSEDNWTKEHTYNGIGEHCFKNGYLTFYLVSS